MVYTMNEGSTSYGHYVMQDHLGVITRKGQVTLPADIRRRLGLKQGDTVAFRLEDGRVVLTPGESVAAATAGIFKRYVDTPRTAEALRAAVSSPSPRRWRSTPPRYGAPLS